MLYKHVCGPRYPVHQVRGVEVMNPRKPYQVSQEELIGVVTRIPSRFKHASESTSIKYQN